jgi:hypothetical protein
MDRSFDFLNTRPVMIWCIGRNLDNWVHGVQRLELHVHFYRRHLKVTAPS